MNREATAKSYLIVCFRYLGDVLVTTPLALSIKTADPDAVVDYLVFEGTEKILAKNPYIRDVITVPRKSSGFRTLLSLFKKYDIAIAAYPSDRTAVAAAVAGKRSYGLTYGLKREWWKGLVLDIHQVCYDRIHVVPNILTLLRGLGVKPIPSVSMGYDKGDSDFAQKTVPFDSYIILHPYSMKNYKFWPAKKWAELASLIQEQTGCVAIFTRIPEPEGAVLLEQIKQHVHHQDIVVLEPCTLNQLAAIIQGAVAFVGVDTAVTHMSASLGTPTLAIYGPSLTRYWAPWPNGSRNPSPFVENKGIQRHGCITVVQKDWPCVPCNEEICRISTRSATECLEDLGVDEVFAEFERVIEHRGIKA
jgi:heptosyltransferase-3